MSLIAIVPTACGIETINSFSSVIVSSVIAIVPTACGIETYIRDILYPLFYYQLQ